MPSNIRWKTKPVIVVTAVISLLSLYFIYVRQPPQLVPLLITQHPRLQLQQLLQQQQQQQLKQPQKLQQPQQRDVREPLNAHVRQAQPQPKVCTKSSVRWFFNALK